MTTPIKKYLTLVNVLTAYAINKRFSGYRKKSFLHINFILGSILICKPKANACSNIIDRFAAQVLITGIKYFKNRIAKKKKSEILKKYIYIFFKKALIFCLFVQCCYYQ